MIFGFDISTNLIGISVLNNDGNLVETDYIDLSKLEKNIWIRIETAKKRIIEICQRHKPKHIFVEEPVFRFTPGKSNSHTIVYLIRFNILCCYVLMQETGIIPCYITASHARKVCGLKMQQKKKAGGKTHKEQTFDQMCQREPFKDHRWELKRTGRPKEYSFDIVDAFVISRAGFLELLADT